jgi:hypothetical protein
LYWTRCSCSLSCRRDRRPNLPAGALHFFARVGRDFGASKIRNFCKKKLPENGCFQGVSGATGRTRTGDLLITNQLLYQLSHSSIKTNLNFQKQIASASDKVNHIIISMQRQHLFPPMLYTRLRVYYGSYFCRITCIF